MNIRAPLPGKILKCCVAFGEEVEKGDVICILESMKMQIFVPAPTRGIIEWIVEEGSTVMREEIITAVNPR